MHHVFEAAELQKEVGEHARGRHLGHQRQAKLHEGLGGGQGFEPLAQVPVVPQHPQLPHPLQAPTAPHLELQQGEGHGSGQAAAGTPGAGHRQTGQAFGFTQQGQEPIVFAQGAADQGQALQGAIGHGRPTAKDFRARAYRAGDPAAGLPSAPRRGWCPGGWRRLRPGQGPVPGC